MSDVYTGPMSPSSERSDPQTQYIRQIAADILSADAANIDFKPRPPLDIQSNCLYEASDGAQRIILKQFLKPDEFGESPLRHEPISPTVQTKNRSLSMITWKGRCGIVEFQPLLNLASCQIYGFS